jgi:hypothetical protein
MLSLCVIDVDCSEIGTDVTVICGEPGELQEEIRALVAAAPIRRTTGGPTFATCNPASILIPQQGKR